MRVCMRVCVCVHAHGSVAQSCLTLVTPRIGACQAPLSRGLSWQEYWSGLPFPPSRDLPVPGVEPVSLASPALAGGFFTRCYQGSPVFHVSSFKWWILLLCYFQLVLNTFGPLHFHVNFTIGFLVSTKKSTENSPGIMLNLS